ncbi:MAG: hypothetical protein J07HB67_01867 [halophilic archaeon J07HB67]|jgi:hypothetical protein|nr:MAG: hypothetical protein J07HB67_01867 [halophilic archaeon J07HB67]
MTAETTSEPPTEAIRRVLSASDSPRYLINPTREFLFALAVVGVDHPPSSPVRVLGRRAVLRELRQDFLMGSRAANLVETETATFREAPLDDETPALVGTDTIHALVLVGETAGSVSTVDETFHADVYEGCESLWADAERYHLRTPPLAALRQSMTAELGAGFRDGFEMALDVVAGLRDRTQFHEVRAALVVAAERELLHYDVGRWGEDAGLASTASFSRHKTDLEDEGILTTEKQPVQMGRPRQRLLLTDEYREIADEEGVATLLSRTTT